MRAYVVKYAGLCNRPSRTISGEVVVEASALRTAAYRAIDAVAKRERLLRSSSISTISLRIAKGGTVGRVTAKQQQRRDDESAADERAQQADREKDA